MYPFTIVVQNQSEWIQAASDDSAAMSAPTVVFPAPGGPVRISNIPLSIPRRYRLAPGRAGAPYRRECGCSRWPNSAPSSTVGTDRMARAPDGLQPFSHCLRGTALAILGTTGIRRTSRWGAVGLNPTNSVPCALCGMLVLAVDVVARRDPRAHPRWDGEALLCPHCASDPTRVLTRPNRR